MILFLLVAGLLVLGVVMLLQAHAAYTNLQDAARLVPQLRQQVVNGEDAQVTSTATAIQAHTSGARDSLGGPQWALAAAVPGLGDNAEAVRALATSSDDIARGVLPAVTELSNDLASGALKPRNGRIALEPLRKARPYVVTSARATHAARVRLDQVPRAHLVGPLRTRFVNAADQVDSLDSMLDTAARAARILPGVLGAQGPRRYLLLVQNNAEPRALGGITGSIIELHTDRGRVELVGQRPAASFGDFGRPVTSLTPGEGHLYGTQLGRFVQNVTGTPDFPRAAQLAQIMWTRKTGQHVDGVAAMDPVALAALLKASGPITLPGGPTLNAGNATEVLLHQVYVQIPDPRAQDAFFANAASAIFDHFVHGGLDVMTSVQVLHQVTDEGRVLFWPALPAEQRQLQRTPIAGELLGRDGGAPVVGVFLHDHTQSKMGWYEAMHVHATPVRCTPGAGRVAVTVTVRSTAPKNIRKQPIYVTGDGSVVRRGNISSQVYVYAPTGARFTGFETSQGKGKRVRVWRHDGLQAATWRLNLARGESVRLRYQVDKVSGDLDGLRVRTTPGPTESQFSASTSSCPS